MAAGVLLLSACAAWHPERIPLGGTADEASKVLGSPTSRYALGAGATRLEYAGGPYGQQTWMVDLDAGGHVSQVRQVLTEAEFAGVHPGASRDEVLLKLGRPGSVAGAWRDRKLWYWRYQNYECRWFVVTLDPDEHVQDSGYAPDPACDDDDSLLFRRR